jgi:hypothetical protein
VLSAASAVNRAAQVAGQSFVVGYFAGEYCCAIHAVRWSVADVIEDLAPDTLRAEYFFSRANRINDRGYVVGTALVFVGRVRV